MNANFESHSISRRSFLKASGVVGAASILAACGGSSSSTAASTSGAASGAAAPAADAITDYVSFETSKRELETWNFLYSQSASDLNVITNCWDGLLSFDCYGKAAPAIASSWEHNEDSTVWTFHLRDNVDWCDVNGEVKSHLTSKDFLVGLEWVLNALKNEAFNTSMPSETVVGAAEYYDLTKDKGDAAADMTYEDMLAAGVGVEAPDDYTLVFTCPSPCPYFDTVVAYNSFYPASEDLIKELGVEGFALDFEDHSTPRPVQARVENLSLALMGFSLDPKRAGVPANPRTNNHKEAIMKARTLIPALLITFAATGCATWDNMSSREKSAATGAAESSGARRSSPTSVMASCMSESGVSVVSATTAAPATAPAWSSTVAGLAAQKSTKRL